MSDRNLPEVRLQDSTGLSDRPTDAADMVPAASVLLQPGVLASPLGRLLLVLIGTAAAIVVLRFLLSIAWTLVSIGAAVVGVMLVLSIFGFL